ASAYMRMRAQTVLVVGALAGLAAPTVLAAQGRGNPAFDAASIKANKSGERGSRGGTISGGRFSATNVTAQQIIAIAFDIPASSISGGPNWITTDHLDIAAKMPEGAYDSQTGFTPNRNATPMLRTLLGRTLSS